MRTLTTMILTITILTMLGEGSASAKNSGPTAEPTQISENKISNGQYIAGGLLGIFPGLGLGHAVQGRYLKRGVFFTAGEAGTWGVTWVAMTILCGGGTNPSSSCVNNVLNVGAATFVGFKAWEIYDVWTPPTYQTAEQQSIENSNSQKITFAPYLLPISRELRAGIGVSF